MGDLLHCVHAAAERAGHGFTALRIRLGKKDKRLGKSAPLRTRDFAQLLRCHRRTMVALGELLAAEKYLTVRGSPFS